MTDREKLVELVCEVIQTEACNRHCNHPPCDMVKEIADNLTANGVTVQKHGRWEDNRCSNCHEEAFFTGWDEPIYDYDWEENLRYSHTEPHIEYHLTGYCPNCGAKMDLEET